MEPDEVIQPWKPERAKMEPQGTTVFKGEEAEIEKELLTSL